MAKILKIKANKDGFRRAGFGFSSKTETILKAKDLTAEQIKALKSEPKLVVVEADDNAAAPTPAEPPAPSPEAAEEPRKEEAADPVPAETSAASPKGGKKNGK